MRPAPWLLAVTVACALSTAARPSRACGGTFCDTGPRAMPVDQKGENILFAVGHGEVEAHIQIQYEGEASRFAWVLPVQALPQVEVGSEALFQNLLAGTVPRFALNSATCGGGVVSSPRGNGAVAVDGGGGGTTVVVQKRVGSFDISVLSGGSATEVAEWLSTNGYAIGPNAPALLSSYVARRFLFVAVKLTGGAGIDQIHPLVVRFAGTEPCVPLELTAVAAVENMGVRTFFLGSRRVVPKNYKHVVLNPVMLNWQSFAPNYDEVVGRAADAPVANGHAFVTEYAGSPSVVSSANLVSPQWNASAFVGAEPARVIEILRQQGLVSFCGGGTCSYTHPLVLPLLRQFLPPPSGVDEGGFYACLACYANDIDRAIWGDGTGFARALEERVIVPGRRASDLLKAHSYLTRMFTTISPAEMTEDPTFEERDGLPPVAFTQTATLVAKCDDKRGVVLPDGREVGLARVIDPASPAASPSMWPTFTPEMPWAERVEEFTNGGAIALVDNGATIDRLLAEWNASVGWVTEGVDAGRGPATGAGGAAGSRGSVVGGSAGGAGPGLDPGFSAASGSGCGCAVPGRTGDRGWGLGGVLVVAGALARRRRPARRN